MSKFMRITISKNLPSIREYNLWEKDPIIRVCINTFLQKYPKYK